MIHCGVSETPRDVYKRQNYLNEQECVDFIASLPVEVDSTFIASGELGKYIVTVRKLSLIHILTG